MSNNSQTGSGQERAFADGNRIPSLGLGVWQIPDGQVCVDAVRTALELGYRHVDTAQDYGNEQSVGRGLSASKIPRGEVFITTKFFPGSEDPVVEIEHSLERLGTEYVDLYLVHWPQGGPTWAWPQMERARELGYARSIGVSNFDVDELEQVISVATVSPVVNQIQLSPFEYRRGLIDECTKRSVVAEAYSPLGTGRHVSDATVKAIAGRIGRTPAQVILRWCLQRDLVVIPKSAHRGRMEENAQIFDFTLSEGDVAELDALDRTGGTSAAQEFKWW